MVIIFRSWVSWVLFVLVPKNSAWEQQATKVEGIVVDVVMESGVDSRTYKPLIRYRDLDAEEKEFLHPIGQNPSPFKVGENVPVLLDPLTREPRLGTFFGLYFISFISFLTGVLVPCYLSYIGY